jgi:AraC-like DNA-binding protein
MNVVGAADLTQAGDFTTTRIPRRLLLQVAPSAEALLARPLGHNRGLKIMIDRYFSLCNDTADDLDALGQRAAAQHMVDLVGLFLGTGTEQSHAIKHRGYSAARLDLMKAEILRDLASSTLAIDGVARTNGMSARQAQRLFAQSGQTFSEFVLEQRLILARRLLRSAPNRNRKISDVAYTAGFSDLSYFNRTFRRRFGATPSEMQFEVSPEQ